MTLLVAIDPGKNKCGLILTDPKAGLVLEGMVVPASGVVKKILEWQQKESLQGIVLGNGTSSKKWSELLGAIAPVQLVEEGGSTLRARRRYWEIWPPSNWKRFVPRGLLLPPGQIDAIAALVLLEDYLGYQFEWLGPPSF